jgi:predicted SnoaL-like aldol condensation-catalyzing enzyme
VTQDPLQRNKEAVVAFYEMMFNDCRPAEAIRLYAGDSYTQHNPHVADGKEAFIAYFERMAREYPGQARDLQARAGRRQLRRPALPPAVADRREQGLGRDRHLPPRRRRQIVEHWDVLQVIPATSANANTMF